MKALMLALVFAAIAVIGATNLPAWADEVEAVDSPTVERAAQGVAEKQEDQQMPVTLLRSDETVKGLSGDAGTAYYFQLYVAPNADRLVVNTTGGNGDTDIYLAYGRLPQPNNYDYVSNKAGTVDKILLRNPRAGTWYALVFGFEQFSNVSLAGSWYQEAQADYYRANNADYAPDTMLSVPWAGADYDPMNVLLCDSPQPWYWFSNHSHFHRDRDHFFGAKPVFYRPSRPIYHHYTTTHYLPDIIRRPGGTQNDWGRRDGFGRRDSGFIQRDGSRRDGLGRRDGQTSFSGRNSPLPRLDAGKPTMGPSEPVRPAIRPSRPLVDLPKPKPFVRPSADAARPFFQFGRSDDSSASPSKTLSSWPQPDVRRSASPTPRMTFPDRTMPAPSFRTEAPRTFAVPKASAGTHGPTVTVPRMERSPSPQFRSESPRFTPRSSAADSPKTFSPSAEVRRSDSRGDSARSGRSDRSDRSSDRDSSFGGGRR